MTIIHASQTLASRRDVAWWASPAGTVHATEDGVVTPCGLFVSWNSWRFVGPIEAVDRALACEACLIATGSTEAELAGGWRPMTAAVQPPPQPCERCGGRGYVTKPCPICGAIRLRAGGLAYQAGSVWGDDPPPVAPRKAGRR